MTLHLPAPEIQNGTAESQTATDLTQKPTSELAGDFARQITELIHSEIELAKAEVSEKGKRLGAGAGGLGVSGVFGFFGLAGLLTTAVVALHLAVVLWLAALIVAGGCFLVAGCTALMAGVLLKKAGPPVPTAAIKSTKEDVEWVKAQAKSARK